MIIGMIRYYLRIIRCYLQRYTPKKTECTGGMLLINCQVSNKQYKCKIGLRDSYDP